MDQTFIDPDTERLVRIATALGNIDVALYETHAPLTVTNFLNYVDRGDWENSFFHKSLSSSVSIIQGGGFTFAAEGQIRQVRSSSAVMNEFSADRPNVCGTIAMAKRSGAPDSATNEWFFNVSDNSQSLDSAVGGFTSFGRVMGDGMTVVKAIAALPTNDFSVDVVTCEGEAPEESCQEAKFDIKDWPLLRLRNDGLDTDDLVTIFSVARLQPLSFSLNSNSAPSVASVDVSETGEMVIDYLAQGQAEIEVGATDRDGVTTSHMFTISVGETFEEWAALAGLAGGDALATANPDHDAFNNLLEYAFGANPAKADSAARGVSVPQGADKVPAITFFYRPSAVDLDYAVQLGNDLAGEWSEVWNSSLGLDHSAVVSKEEMGDGILKVTVGAANAELPAFLRVYVSNL
ncbi:MAG: peptidylprolyl isomerase [Verrucomicrobiae bacterium]|nr:peptidylprolyl isomerase [Verrucomicrobiae bacterium]